MTKKTAYLVRPGKLPSVLDDRYDSICFDLREFDLDEVIDWASNFLNNSILGRSMRINQSIFAIIHPEDHLSSEKQGQLANVGIMAYGATRKYSNTTIHTEKTRILNESFQALNHQLEIFHKYRPKISNKEPDQRDLELYRRQTQDEGYRRNLLSRMNRGSDDRDVD
jgi:hypothetical protein